MKSIYILVFSFLLIACGQSEKNKAPLVDEASNTNQILVSQKQFEGENMQFGKLEKQAFYETIKTSGMIDVPPSNKANINAFMGGYITKIPLLIGDKVKKGQLLVTLENPEFIEIQQQYLEIAEQLSYLKSEFTRQQTLYNEKISSQKNFLQAESTYKSSLAQYNGLRKKLIMMNLDPTSVEQGNITSTLNLYALINGYVSQVNVSNGSYVSPSDAILEIVNTEHIHLELLVFEKDVLKITKGQKILFKIPEASEDTYSAEVYLVGKTIDETTRMVKVHAHIDEKTDFIVGMFVEASILTAEDNSLALPNEAVFEIDNNFFCLVLNSKKNDTFYFDKVKLDIEKQTETHTAIRNSDSLINKDILTKGGFMLLGENNE